MKRIISGLFCLLFIVFGQSLQVSGQNTSNKGTDFWLAYAGHIDGKASRMTLFLSADINTTYQVEGNGQVISSGNITANVITPVFIDPNVYDVYIGSSDQVESQKGIHITSKEPISVYSVISNSARTGGSLILPTKSLGREYYAFSYQNAGGSQNGNARSEFTIVAVEDNTEIEITPSSISMNGFRTANSTFKLTQKLNKGDVYQYQSPNDVSGSIIRTLGACKPVAVFSGSTWTAFCEDGNTRTNPNTPLPGRPTPSGGDNLFQQLFPVTAWGKNFVTAPFYNTENGNVDAIRIIVSEDNTTITVNGSTTNANGTILNNPYKKGSIVTYFTSIPSIVKSDKPIGVAQYQSAQNCNASNSGPNPAFVGDPEMTILNPIEQTLNDITVFSKLNSIPGVRTQITKYFLNVIIKTADSKSLKVDGIAVSGFKNIDAEYSYAIIDVTGSQDQHRIVADGGFVAIAYGYGSVESYAYLAGADVKNLYKNISVSSKKNVVVTTGCVSSLSKFSLKLPYQTSSIVWNLDNGQSSYTDSNPKFTTLDIGGVTVYNYEYPLSDAIYSKIGKYKVTAIATNPDPSGCDPLETVSLDFEVFDPPVAKFGSISQSCVDIPISFSDSSSAKSGKIVKWLWDFGDRTISTEQNPKHSYTKGGDYQVKLMVEGETGCESDVFTQNVHVSINPVAGFSFSTPDCVQQAITFKDSSSSQEGKIIKWLWDPGDGSTAVEYTSATNFTHSYAKAGTYNVSLKILTDKGCENVLMRQLIVKPVPVVNFGIPEVCIRDAFAAFTDSSTIADGSGSLTYLWNFGDEALSTAGNPNTSNLKNPQHRYTRAGNYSVSLTVTSADGCSTTLSKSFTVNGAIPTASFEVLNDSKLCSNQEVVFRNTSTVDFGDVGKVEWYFDFDGDQSFKLVDENPFPGKEYRIQYPVFSSPAKREFKVRMLAYSGGSCRDDELKVISVISAPKVVFNLLPDVCQEIPPFKITQAAEENLQAGTGLFYGKGVSPEGIFNPAAAGVGTHIIKYVFTSLNGCADSLSREIKVMPTPTVYAGKDTVVLQGGEIRLKGIGAGSNLSYKWSPSIGLNRDDIPDPVASPFDDMTYTLTVTSDQGCVSMDKVFVKVLKEPEVPNAFSPNGDGMNDLWNIKYLESYANASVKVFSRYGALVYVSNGGYAHPWNGQMNGIDLPSGTYYYIVDPKTKGRKLVSGFVTILR